MRSTAVAVKHGLLNREDVKHAVAAERGITEDHVKTIVWTCRRGVAKSMHVPQEPSRRVRSTERVL